MLGTLPSIPVALVSLALAVVAFFTATVRGRTAVGLRRYRLAIARAKSQDQTNRRLWERINRLEEQQRQSNEERESLRTENRNLQKLCDRQEEEIASLTRQNEGQARKISDLERQVADLVEQVAAFAGRSAPRPPRHGDRPNP